MNIGEKINRFDNLLYSNARQFETLFNLSLSVPPETKVEVLGLEVGGFRRLNVGGTERVVDLLDTDMIYSKELGRVISKKGAYSKKPSKETRGTGKRPRYKYSIEKDGAIQEFYNCEELAQFLQVNASMIVRRFNMGYDLNINGYLLSREKFNGKV